MESHGQLLLDLSLYVSSENYRTTTLPAYSCILPWPEQWLIPSQHRAVAKLRTDHLSFSSLDLDNDTEMNRKSILEMIPTSLRSSRQSVSSLVSLPQHAARFRLDALADDWLGPLQELLGEKLYLLSDQRPSSLDCLAFAYLALAVVPVVPQPWLKESVLARYPKLAAYVNKLVQLFRGPNHVMQSPRSADTASSLESNLKEGEGSEGVLPWREPQPRGFRLTLMALFENVFASLPILGGYQNGIIIPQGEAAKLIHSPNDPKGVNSSHRATLPAILAAGTTTAAIAAFLLYGGLTIFNNEPVSKKRSLSDLGEAGVLLAMADYGTSDTKISDRRSDNGLASVAEVAVTVEGIEEL